jgi:hypothetical protein
VPDGALLRGVLQMHESVIGQREVGQLALAPCRPGDATPTDDDQEWAQILCDELGGLIDQTRSLHLAAGGAVVPLVDHQA